MKTFDEVWLEKSNIIPGLVMRDEMALIWKVISQSSNTLDVFVEIGSLFGLSSSIIASVIGDKKLYCIENFAVQGSDARPFFKEKTMKMHPNIVLLEMSSDKAATEFFQPIDFIFIDGDHQDDGIQRDVKNWLPKMNSGGFVAFHDYHNDMFPSIRRRVEEVTQSWQMIGQSHSLLIKQKP